ncbi:ParB/RepB/Spo0J family partition protein [Streptomyces sp. MNP-20]|uniref:ParB/RepB/Spo0J family partition protein n=1 Tax=Streptomyces sp. MNP-20 TaxID=2721165 RepID=UPI001554B814|nr:ParB/RepB/Spo0J family partition protein [Streptomyces sp. MNP-20]
MPHKYATLKMAQIHRNPGQPRETFGEEALKELTDSIRQHGLLQPVVVRKADKGYELVAGERRFRANDAAGNITIEAKILLGDGAEGIDDLTSFKKAMAENLNREDMLPLEEARGFKKVLDAEEDATPATVAATFSKTVPYVTQRLALLALRPEIAKAVDLGHIGTQAAVQIAALTPGNQKAVFETWKKGQTTDNQLVHIAYAMRKQEKAPAQDSMVQVEEMTDEEKAKRVREQAKTRSDLDEIERICGLLDGIRKADPMELARHLEGEVGKRLEQMDRVSDLLQKARFQLRQAKAHADATAIMVNPDMAAPDLAAEAEAAQAQLAALVNGSGEPETAPAQPASAAKEEGEAAPVVGSGDADGEASQSHTTVDEGEASDAAEGDPADSSPALAS